jgi:DNA primase
MSITPRFLDDVRARLTLSEFIGRRIKVTRSGREYKACCPFHKEKTPSFYINDDKQFFHCFGCGAHGDVVGFAMRHDNLSFPEAVEQLAAQAGLKMPEQSPADIERAASEKSLFAMMDVATKWFEEQLVDKRNREVLEYLTGRGLTMETISGFRLGYAPADDQLLRKHLLAEGYNDDDMLSLGLIKKREKGGDPYVFFRDRVMFPVADRSGRVIAFGGRVLPEHLRPPTRSDFKPPKYINSPETPLFFKGQTVYALARARQAARDNQPIIVVEGYMDVIACHQAGFGGVVAPLGTALTEEQITLLWRLMPGPERIVTLCFDGDGAGRRAAERAADRILPLLKPDHSARIAFLPDGEDPDTLVLKQGRTALQNVLDRGISLADYLWQIHANTRTLDRPEDRAGFEAELDALVERITDPKVKFHYQKFFREKLNAQFRPTAYKSGGAFVPRKPGTLLPPNIKPVAGWQRPDRVYLVLLATVLNHPAMFDDVDEDLGSLSIQDPLLDAFRQNMLQHLSEDSNISVAALCSVMRQEKPEFATLVDNMTNDKFYETNPMTRPSTEIGAVVGQWRDTVVHLRSPKRISS